MASTCRCVSFRLPCVAICSGFADSIEHHPLLIYTTALPFTPQDSPVYVGYMDARFFPRNSCDWELDWSSNLLVLSKHEGSVSSVSFSPDGVRVISGSHDKTIRVEYIIRHRSFTTTPRPSGHDWLSFLFSRWFADCIRLQGPYDSSVGCDHRR